MIEESAENAFSTDNGRINTEQPRSQSGDRLNQRSIANNMIPTVNHLSKQIKELDKKNTRIEELVSSIKKEIKNVVMTIEKTNHQYVSDDSARIKEFHDEIPRLQMQTQRIQQAINDIY
jgi:chromosome segregation ATPase